MNHRRSQSFVAGRLSLTAQASAFLCSLCTVEVKLKMTSSDRGASGTAPQTYAVVSVTRPQNHTGTDRYDAQVH
uniref:Secreted protein n=1 Tax=Anguilla anguilla TaxID=7936 RepID=A0A0E9RB99_ANGAN